jgi:hypothetical protein
VLSIKVNFFYPKISHIPLNKFPTPEKFFSLIFPTKKYISINKFTLKIFPPTNSKYIFPPSQNISHTPQNISSQIQYKFFPPKFTFKDVYGVEWKIHELCTRHYQEQLVNSKINIEKKQSKTARELEVIIGHS